MIELIRQKVNIDEMPFDSISGWGEWPSGSRQ